MIKCRRFKVRTHKSEWRVGAVQNVVVTNSKIGNLNQVVGCTPKESKDDVEVKKANKPDKGGRMKKNTLAKIATAAALSSMLVGDTAPRSYAFCHLF